MASTPYIDALHIQQGALFWDGIWDTACSVLSLVQVLLVVQNSAEREIESLSANTDFLWDKRTGLAAKTVIKQVLVVY